MPFTPGDPNINRKGRPKKGETLTDALRDIVDKEALAKKLVSMADEDFAALKYIYDRIDGRPKETIAGDSENPLMGFVIKRAEESEDD